MFVCTPAVMQGDKIHICRRVIADEVKGVLKPRLFFSNDAHGHMMRQTRVSKVCPICILMSSGGLSEW